MKPSFSVLSEDDPVSIDYKTRRILSEKGVRVLDDECRRLMAEFGCVVSDGSDVVRFPSEVIDRALETVPHSFTLYGRGDKYAVEQSCDGPTSFTTYGPCIRVMRYQGHNIFETVDAKESDFIEAVKVCDWASNISFISTPISASNWIDNGCKDMHELVLSITNSKKHFHHVEPDYNNIHYYFELEKILYNGDEDKARERPLVSVMACAISPLTYNTDATQTIIRAGNFGIPVNILSMALAGATAPIFIAGLLVMQNAEILAGVVISQAANPGAKVWYGSSSTIFDPRKGSVAAGSPEMGIISTASAQMAQFYGIPSFSTGMLTESKTPDSQSAHERTISSLLPTMVRTSALYGMGTLDTGAAFSPEQLVIDDEIISMESIITRGIIVDDETMFADGILGLKEGESFLENRSTVINAERVSKAVLFDRDNINHNLRFNKRNIEDAAHDKVQEVLATYKVEPLPRNQEKALRELITKADSEYRLSKRF